MLLLLKKTSTASSRNKLIPTPTDAALVCYLPALPTLVAAGRTGLGADRPARHIALLIENKWLLFNLLAIRITIWKLAINQIQIILYHFNLSRTMYTHKHLATKTSLFYIIAQVLTRRTVSNLDRRCAYRCETPHNTRPYSRRRDPHGTPDDTGMIPYPREFHRPGTKPRKCN